MLYTGFFYEIIANIGAFYAFYFNEIGKLTDIYIHFLGFRTKRDSIKKQRKMIIAFFYRKSYDRANNAKSRLINPFALKRWFSFIP